MHNTTSEHGRPQRLKRKDLAMGILYKFSEIYESSEAESITDISIPIDQARLHLKERFGVEYTSNQWIFTQLKRYEDEINSRLFEKTKVRGPNEFSLSLYPEMIEFTQKIHLHIPKKIVTANGIFEKIHLFAKGKQSVSLCLGAGSTTYYLAQIFIDQMNELATKFQLYSHNAGILSLFYNHPINSNKIQIISAGGELDPITMTLVGNPKQMFPTQTFDFIVQGTSIIHDGNLYIESDKEREVKASLLHNHQGCKILVSTKHEFQDEPPKDIEPYGKITDYDYIVVPRKMGSNYKKQYDLKWESYLEMLEPEIMNWNYSIYRIKK
jgi:DeoR/GlpR family transcriptional regulator of sugar metabolism